MRDPYEVLNVSRNASDDEVKSAYRELARKYHPDNYANNDDPTVSSLFEEKMKEINEAYDTIVTNRRNGTDSSTNYSQASSNSNQNSGQSYSQSNYSRPNYNQGYSQQNTGYNQGYNANAYSSSYNSASGAHTDFADIRQLLMAKRYTEAEDILKSVPPMRQNAEWYFLYGTVLYHRGWIEQAYEHFSQAVQLDPMNPEYRAAYNSVQTQRSGRRGGYVYDTDRAERGCNPLSLCCSLFCADSCCECFGGDMISCC